MPSGWNISILLKLKVKDIDGADCRTDRKGGTHYGIIGENGSGKTMLLRLLAGLIHPDDGEVHYGGKKVKKLTQVVNIGLSIENIGLYDDMTVYQNMKYYAKLSGGCDKRKIEETLQRMGLT